jgi:hypothetical protein
MRLRVLIAAAVLFPSLLHAQRKRGANASGYDNADRATLLHTANLYVTADSAAPPVTTIAPGHEVILQQKNGDWVNVFANVDVKDEAENAPEFTDPNAKENPEPSTGWIRDKGVVGPKTPHGDTIIFGAAAELEAQASEPHPPAGAAAAAHRLYQRVVDYFPESTLAPEALFRAADIRWQLDKNDIATLPSAHEQDAFLRPRLEDRELKLVMKMYPDSDWAARAAFDLLDAKMCGDWQGLPKCPEQEAQIYLKYADQYRGGPKTAEALYNAAYRQGVLVTMYRLDEQQKRSDAAAKNCQSIADELLKDYAKSDYATRAASIAYRVAQGIPVYGSDREYAYILAAQKQVLRKLRMTNRIGDP